MRRALVVLLLVGGCCRAPASSGSTERSSADWKPGEPPPKGTVPHADPEAKQRLGFAYCDKKKCPSWWDHIREIDTLDGKAWIETTYAMKEENRSPAGSLCISVLISSPDLQSAFVRAQSTQQLASCRRRDGVPRVD
jgi:hypothetical protein